MARKLRCAPVCRYTGRIDACEHAHGRLVKGSRVTLLLSRHRRRRGSRVDIWSRYAKSIDFINAPMPGKYWLYLQKLGYEAPRVYTVGSPVTPFSSWLFSRFTCSPALHHELRSIEVNDIDDQIERRRAYCFLFFPFCDSRTDRNVRRNRKNLYARRTRQGRADISKSTQPRVQRARSDPSRRCRFTLAHIDPHGLPSITVAAWSFVKSIGSAA